MSQPGQGGQDPASIFNHVNTRGDQDFKASIAPKETFEDAEHRRRMADRDWWFDRVMLAMLLLAGFGLLVFSSSELVQKTGAALLGSVVGALAGRVTAKK